METNRYLESVAGWARARLAMAGGQAAAASDAAAPAVGDAMAELVARFGLTDEERQVLELALAVETSFETARAARALSGRRGLTVELIRAALGGEASLWLGASGALRTHGLVTVGGIPSGLTTATAAVALAPGMAERLVGRPPEPSELGPGIEWVLPTTEKPALPESLALVVRDDLIDVRARWVTISGAHPNDAAALAGALVRRLKRPTILVDARALEWLDGRDRWTLLAVLRREADLRDAPLLVDGAARLGATWRALGARPAPGRTLPAPIVMLDAGTVPEGRPHPTYAIREITFAAPGATAGVGAAAAAASGGVATPEAVDEGFEAARRQAAVDAARAMGKPIQVTRDQMPSKAIVPRSMATAPSSPTPAAPPLPVVAAVPVETPAAAATAPPTTPATAPASVSPVAAAASTPTEAAPAAAPARPAVEATTSPPASSVPDVPTATEPTPSIAATSPEAGAAAATLATETPGSVPATPSGAPLDGAPSAPPTDAAPSAPAPDPAEALPYVTVPAEATLVDLLRLMPTVNNPLQRAELLRKVGQEKGHTQVVLLLRAHLKAEHPAVRAAAEEGMQVQFGANWNRGRAIPKPVQPPHGNDPDRGPPGGY